MKVAVPLRTEKGKHRGLGVEDRGVVALHAVVGLEQVSAHRTRGRGGGGVEPGSEVGLVRKESSVGNRIRMLDQGAKSPKR